MTDMQIKGLDKVLKVMSRLPDRVQTKVVGAATRHGGAVIRRAARANAKRYKNTGLLHKSLSIWTPKKKERGAYTVLVGPRGKFYTKGSLRRHHPNKKWQADGFYARFLEQGTSRQPARPYLRPAFDAHKEQVVMDIEKRLWKGVQRELERLK